MREGCTDCTDELRVEAVYFERRENVSLNVLKQFSSRAIFRDEIPVTDRYRVHSAKEDREM